MRHFFLLTFFLAIHTLSFGQKKPLGQLTCEHWPSVDNLCVSNDGKYDVLFIKDEEGNKTLTIKDTESDWNLELPGISDGFITQDSKFFIYPTGADNAAILKLGTIDIRNISNIKSYKVPESGDGKLLAYLRMNKNGSEVVILNIEKSEETVFPHAKDYYFDNAGKVLLYTSTGNTNNSSQLIWVNLQDLKADTISVADSIGNFVFDANADRLAFLEYSGQNNYPKALLYYKAGMKSPITLIDLNDLATNQQLEFYKGKYEQSYSLTFSKNGQQVLFSVKRLSPLKIDSNKAGKLNIDIWTYKDEFLQSMQLYMLHQDFPNKVMKAVITLSNKRIILLTTEADDFYALQYYDTGNEINILARSNKNPTEAFWNENELPSFYLISSRDGTRKTIAQKPNQDGINFSANGKFVVWFDRKQKAYYTYELSTGLKFNVTREIPFPVFDNHDDHPGLPQEFGMAGWLPNDKSILIYDQFDVWKVNPHGLEKPVNLSNGYGRKHQTVLRFFDNDNQIGVPIIDPDESQFLVGFNLVNKYNGFFKINLSKALTPVLLTMSPDLYYLPLLTQSTLVYTNGSFTPKKAKNTNKFICRRMKVSEYPNYYSTSDFKNFHPLSHLVPQKEYNWLTSELVHWSMPDRTQATGILYKPENFDPHKKYPVIFFYYEQRSNGLNMFINPELSYGELEIPYFVSNGYLVFVPDIHYKIDYAGESALTTVVSAANYMAKMPWVDPAKMGLQGHSFGGYETNYIVTHSHLFAAACEAAGPSDLCSWYNSLRMPEGVSNQYVFEGGQVRQLRIAETLWQRPDLYIKNSPIFKADQVQTPLLIMHNDMDGIVPWDQAMEWFTALRRLRKKVWLLNYEKEEHSTDEKDNQLDFSIRLKQFFDHFLEGAPEPKWMAEGIPATAKGYDLGYETANNK